MKVGGWGAVRRWGPARVLTPDSTLSLALQSLVELICDVKMMKNQMVEIG